MITKQDILEAIAECQGIRSPNANTAIKLAAFYTILDHLEDTDKTGSAVGQDDRQSFAGYSLSDFDMSIVHYNGTTDFAHVIDGRRQADIWPIMDELMTTIRVLNERLYSGVMKKLEK